MDPDAALAIGGNFCASDHDAVDAGLVGLYRIGLAPVATRSISIIKEGRMSLSTANTAGARRTTPSTSGTNASNPRPDAACSRIGRFGTSDLNVFRLRPWIAANFGHGRQYIFARAVDLG